MIVLGGYYSIMKTDKIEVKIQPELKQAFKAKCESLCINPSEWIRKQIENFTKDNK